jgi:acetyltransferase-like isoleucine patch superfamily enzyme
MVVLPSRLKRHLGRLIFGWEIDPTAHLGRSLVLVRHLSMGPGTRIGSFNVIKDLEELRLAEGASIVSRNWIIGIPLAFEYFPNSPNRRPSLIMGKRAIITINHNIQCTDLVRVGDYSAIAGFGSAILTHSLDLVRDQFVSGPVEIGDHAAVMSGCTLNNGTRVPSRSIVSAGSVVTTRLTRELTLYRGNPAEPVRSLPETLGYFHRGEEGFESVRGSADIGA